MVPVEGASRVPQAASCLGRAVGGLDVPADVPVEPSADIAVDDLL
jgi:hypothetical protein